MPNALYDAVMMNTAGTSTVTWTQWNYSTGTTTNTVDYSADTIWMSWAENTTTGQRVPVAWQNVQPSPPAFPEANAKAEALLREVLDPSQLAELEANDRFDVRGSDGEVYCIRRGQVQNVYRRGQDGRFRTRLCAHPQGQFRVPDADAMAAQKLLIETDVEAFLRVANEARMH